MCSEHFVNGRKSEHPNSVSYNPTIFPSIYKTKAPADSGRLQRALEREKKKESKEREIESKENDCNLSEVSETSMFAYNF